MAVEIDFKGMVEGVKFYFSSLDQTEQIGFGLVAIGFVLLIVGFVIGI